MRYLLLLLLPFVVISCQRGIDDITEPVSVINCDLLKQGMIENNILMISESLGPLLDEQYSNDNLNQIAQDISASCSITAMLTCYNCIKTIPPQSQLQCTFIEDNGEYATYIINVAYARNNKIEIVSVER